MASIFKRTRKRTLPADHEIITDKKGRRFVKYAGRRGKIQKHPLSDDGKHMMVEDEKYLIGYMDHEGKKRVVTGAASYQLSQTIANRLEGDKALRKHGVIDTHAEALQVEASRPIAEHLDDYETKMIASGSKTGLVDETRRVIEIILNDCKATTAAEITADGVQRFLVKMKNENKSVGTRNKYLAQIKAFTRWLTMGDKIARNPLEKLRAAPRETDRRYERRALQPQEFQWLIHAAANGDEWRGIPGRERALIYAVAIQTGLRAAEMKSLTRSSFNLDAKNPTVTVRAKATKNSKQCHQSLKPETARELAEHLKTKTPAASAFKMPTSMHTAKMIRHDLAIAKRLWVDDAPPTKRDERANSDFLSETDSDGMRIDFHSLRHSCGTWLAINGAPPKVIQSVMRHSTIVLTLDRYGHLMPGSEADAIAKLPDMTTTTGGLRLTGG